MFMAGTPPLGTLCPMVPARFTLFLYTVSILPYLFMTLWKPLYGAVRKLRFLKGIGWVSLLLWDTSFKLVKQYFPEGSRL